MQTLKKSHNILTITLFILYLLALVWIIVFKLQFSLDATDRVRTLNLIPLQRSFGDNGFLRISEIVDNILFFLPFGIYLCMLKNDLPFVKKVLCFMGTSLVFEGIQYVFAIGRADITDILANTLGGILGIGIYVLLSKLLKSRTHTVINALAVILAGCALVLAAMLLAHGRWIRLQ